MTTPQPSDTATPMRTLRGSGHVSSRRAIRGTTVKIATTAANESWKPGSYTLVRVPGEQRHRRRAAAPATRRAAARSATRARRAPRRSPRGSPTAAGRPRARTRRSLRARRARRPSGSPRAATREAAHRPRPARRSGPTPPRCGRDPTPGSPVAALGESCEPSPRTIPSRTARRSPPSPGAIERSSHVRSRSASPAEAAALADLRPLVDAQDDVDAVVGAARCARRTRSRAPRQLHDDERVEDRRPAAASGRAELELHRLVDTHARRNERTRPWSPDVENRPTLGWRGHDHDGTPGLARPAPAGRSGRASRAGGSPTTSRGDRAGPGDTRSRGAGSVPRRDRARPASDATARPHEAAPTFASASPSASARASRCAGARPGDHDGMTSPRRLSIRAGPMPGIASRSSTEVNGPCSVR